MSLFEFMILMVVFYFVRKLLDITEEKRSKGKADPRVIHIKFDWADQKIIRPVFTHTLRDVEGKMARGFMLTLN